MENEKLFEELETVLESTVIDSLDDLLTEAFDSEIYPLEKKVMKSKSDISYIFADEEGDRYRLQFLSSPKLGAGVVKVYVGKARSEKLFVDKIDKFANPKAMIASIINYFTEHLLSPEGMQLRGFVIDLSGAAAKRAIPLMKKVINATLRSKIKVIKATFDPVENRKYLWAYKSTLKPSEVFNGKGITADAPWLNGQEEKEDAGVVKGTSEENDELKVAKAAKKTKLDKAIAAGVSAASELEKVFSSKKLSFKFTEDGDIVSIELLLDGKMVADDSVFNNSSDIKTLTIKELVSVFTPKLTKFFSNEAGTKDQIGSFKLVAGHASRSLQSIHMGRKFTTSVEIDNVTDSPERRVVFTTVAQNPDSTQTTSITFSSFSTDIKSIEKKIISDFNSIDSNYGQYSFKDNQSSALDAFNKKGVVSVKGFVDKFLTAKQKKYPSASMSSEVSLDASIESAPIKVTLKVNDKSTTVMFPATANLSTVDALLGDFIDDIANYSGTSDSKDTSKTMDYSEDVYRDKLISDIKKLTGSTDVKVTSYTGYRGIGDDNTVEFKLYVNNKRAGEVGVNERLLISNEITYEGLLDKAVELLKLEGLLGDSISTSEQLYAKLKPKEVRTDSANDNQFSIEKAFGGKISVVAETRGYPEDALKAVKRWISQQNLKLSPSVTVEYSSGQGDDSDYDGDHAMASAIYSFGPTPKAGKFSDTVAANASKPKPASDKVSVTEVKAKLKDLGLKIVKVSTGGFGAGGNIERAYKDGAGKQVKGIQGGNRGPMTVTDAPYEKNRKVKAAILDMFRKVGMVTTNDESTLTVQLDDKNQVSMYLSWLPQYAGSAGRDGSYENAWWVLSPVTKITK